MSYDYMSSGGGMLLARLARVYIHEGTTRSYANKRYRLISYVLLITWLVGNLALFSYAISTLSPASILYGHEKDRFAQSITVYGGSLMQLLFYGPVEGILWLVCAIGRFKYTRADRITSTARQNRRSSYDIFRPTRLKGPIT